jgi:alpha-galactosidase
LELPGGQEDLRFFRMGYQSWSPAGFLPLRSRDRRPRLRLARRMHFGPSTPLPRRNLHVSDFVTTLRAPGHAGLTLGFLTHHRYLTHVALEHAGKDITKLRARVATEGLPLGADAALESERLWIGLDEPGQDGLASWADRAGSAMEATVPDRVGSAWCSWYQFYADVTAEDIRRNTRALSELCPRIETVQIDDGFQSAVGDWLQAGEGFPDGIAPLAREIRDADFRAGLWLAPLLVSRASRVADRHPDWLLRGRDGQPRIAAFNPAWKGKLCYALDPTHPEVQAWLEELARTVRGYGFDYLKLDFLYAGALRGARYDRNAPAAAAYRAGIEALRRGAGEDCFFVRTALEGASGRHLAGHPGVSLRGEQPSKCGGPRSVARPALAERSGLHSVAGSGYPSARIRGPGPGQRGRSLGRAGGGLGRAREAGGAAPAMAAAAAPGRGGAAGATRAAG